LYHQQHPQQQQMYPQQAPRSNPFSPAASPSEEELRKARAAPSRRTDRKRERMTQPQQQQVQ
jgi:hypothetical protein